MSPREYVEFARFSLLPVRRLGEEQFGGEAARRLVAGSALHADLPPEGTMSGFFGWLMCSLGQGVDSPSPPAAPGRPGRNGTRFPGRPRG